jgi:hypothetical protein
MWCEDYLCHVYVEACLSVWESGEGQGIDVTYICMRENAKSSAGSELNSEYAISLGGMQAVRVHTVSVVPGILSPER